MHLKLYVIFSYQKLSIKVLFFTLHFQYEKEQPQLSISSTTALQWGKIIPQHLFITCST